MFEPDYVGEHITLGYAATVHSAQGITVGDSQTAGVCYAILSEHATRATAYVAMTRGKDENHAFIYQQITGEADHDHATPVAGVEIHRLRRGNKYAAAHYFKTILANDDRPRTMHAEAERTPAHLLPEVVADLLERNNHRRADRRETWRHHTVAERAREAAHQRITQHHGAEQSQDRRRNRSDDGYGLEL